MPATIVRRLWERIEARDWDGAKSLFAEEAVMVWWTSGEEFAGRDGIIAVNAIYPEGWSIEVVEVNELTDGRVHSVVRVPHAVQGQVFYANSLFSFRAGRIARLDEYWATVEAAPEWRVRAAIPGYRVLPS